jgi:GntR family transcriptional repressor for pyruvate dehydrogenase complex
VDELKPQQKAALTLAQEIARIIHDEGLRPGDRYLSESEAVARHGVARGTFREALRFLELQGVIRVKAGPGGGAIVTRPDWTSLASTLALLLQFEDASLLQVLEARRVMAPGMADLAVKRATAEEIDAMAAQLELAAAGVSDYPAFSAAYRAYWRLLARSTRNPLLALLAPALRAIVDSGGFIPDETRRVRIVERLRQLHAAVADRDGERARTLITEIETAFLDRLVEGYPQRIVRPIAWADLKLDLGDN